jgi:hypothetical protein
MLLHITNAPLTSEKKATFEQATSGQKATTSGQKATTSGQKTTSASKKNSGIGNEYRKSEEIDSDDLPDLE